MKIITLLCLLFPITLKAQNSYGDPQAFLVPPPGPDSLVAVYDSIKSFIYWTNPPIPLSVKKEYLYDENYRIASYITYDLYDELGNGYLFPTFKNTYTYNDLGLLTGITIWQLVDQDWSIYSSSNFTYDDDGYLLTSLSNDLYTTYEWDTSHRLLSEIELQGMDTTSAFYRTYDSIGNKSTELYRAIWEPGTQIRDLTFTQLTYDEQNNNHIGTLLLDKYETEQWDTSKRITYSYNQQNMLLDSLIEDFKEVFLSIHTFIKYDQNLNPDSIISYWMYPGYWQNYKLELRDYDNMNRLISKIIYDWNDNTNTWTQSLWFLWDYDDNGNITEEQLVNDYRISSVWDENNFLVSRLDSREDADSTHYYFKTQTIVKSTNLPVIRSLQVYPNPGHDHIIFKTEDIQSGTIAITDLNGKNLIVIPVTGSETIWYPKNLSPGVYLFQLVSGRIISQGKVVLR
ncbi:MAG TPA: T9SS type A sorting domain-containing protein [Lentimicrobium sp.]|nr:T9SS type A sorting domain-containing protein [Lentimicrobium sp.]